jgi:hypothetical protein
MLIRIQSAIPVQNNQFLPVFCFYASLPRTSLLQGNTSTGANGAKIAFHFWGCWMHLPLFINPIAVIPIFHRK